MKVNDYVRTKDGIIAKCISEECDKYVFDKIIVEDGYYLDYEYKDITPKSSDIKISSSNIIDLIEEGDILKVNDFKDVYTIYEVEMFRNPYTNEKYLGIRNDFSKRPKRLYEIPLVNLSIVTKEQFESMEYKIKEEII